MANKIKNYFLSPSWDYGPNGPIAIGNIVRAPNKVVPPLYWHQTQETDPRMFTSFKENFEWSTEKNLETNFGIWTKFLEALGLGVDLETGLKKMDGNDYSFERIETEEFFPDDNFIRKSMATPAVKSYLEKSRFKKSVYMIVGIKKVSGASVKSVIRNERSGLVDFGIDGTITGIPISLGPKIDVQGSHKDSTSFERSSDFVFAYRLRKVRVRKDDEVEQDDYNRGALFGAHTDESPDTETFTPLGLEDQDASPEAFCLEQAMLVVDGIEKVGVCTSF